MQPDQHRGQLERMVALVALLTALVIPLVFHLWIPPANNRFGEFVNSFLPSAMVTVIAISVVYFFFSRHGIKLGQALDEDSLISRISELLSNTPSRQPRKPEAPTLSLTSFSGRETHDKLKGLWLESFLDSSDGNFALGAFYWDDNFKAYRYDGTRFDRTGKAIYHWKSRSLFCDDKLEKVIYTYQHEFLDGTTREPKYGLGEIQYSTEAGGNTMRFVGGVFSDQDDNRHMKLQMQRWSEVAKDHPVREQLDEKSRINLGAFYARMVRGAE